MEEVAAKEGEGRLLKKYHRADAWDATKQAVASLNMFQRPLKLLVQWILWPAISPLNAGLGLCIWTSTLGLFGKGSLICSPARFLQAGRSFYDLNMAVLVQETAKL